MSEHWDAHRELYELTRAFRQHLIARREAGVHDTIDGSTRAAGEAPVQFAPIPGNERGESPRRGSRAPGPSGAAARPGRDQGRQNMERPPPAEPEPSRYGDATPQDALGFSSMSEALAHMLGDGKQAPQRRSPGQSARTEQPAPARAAEPQRAAASPVTGSAERTDSAGSGARLTLAQVRAELGECTRCKLAPTRTNIVFGVGDPNASLMFIGEGPGRDEDLRGEPFVGAAGQLLNKMIAAMGWSRETVYIANVVKCRPPGNRDPEGDEVAACEPFLARQVEAVRPRIIVTLGRPATHLILRTTTSLGRLRGHLGDYRGIPVMPTYHPAYLLRNPDGKGATWSDLQKVMGELQRMGVPAPHPHRGR